MEVVDRGGDFVGEGQWQNLKKSGDRSQETEVRKESRATAKARSRAKEVRSQETEVRKEPRATAKARSRAKEVSPSPCCPHLPVLLQYDNNM
jgi:hypothetical protein